MQIFAAEVCGNCLGKPKVYWWYPLKETATLSTIPLSISTNSYFGPTKYPRRKIFGVLTSQFLWFLPRYQSKTMRAQKICQITQLCPNIAKGQRAPNAQLTHQIVIDTMRTLSPAARTLKPIRIRSNRWSHWHHFIRLYSLIVRVDCGMSRT